MFDLSGAVASASSGMFAAYKVTTFDEVPATLKDPNGLWVNDYGGYLSIGYDADKVPGRLHCPAHSRWQPDHPDPGAE